MILGQNIGKYCMRPEHPINNNGLRDGLLNTDEDDRCKNTVEDLENQMESPFCFEQMTKCVNYMLIIIMTFLFHDHKFFN